MIEWLLSSLVRILVWLWTSAATLYYLAGFFIVLGGLVMFTGSVIHHSWKRSLEDRVSVTSRERPTNVHIENLHVTLEVTESQVRELLEAKGWPALPPGDPNEQDRD
jgi:hypothetical protein